MFAELWIRWILTLGFAVFASCSLWLTMDTRWHVPRVGYILHALMNLSMIAMLWPAGRHLAPLAQSVFFALSALWFVVLSLAPATGLNMLPDRDHPLWHNVYHAVMMAAMAWMLLAMSPALMTSMATAEDNMHMAGHMVSHHDVSEWLFVANGVSLIAMLVGTVLFVHKGVLAVRGGDMQHRGALVEAFAIAGMSIGMAAMFAVMMAG